MPGLHLIKTFETDKVYKSFVFKSELNDEKITNFREEDCYLDVDEDETLKGEKVEIDNMLIVRFPQLMIFSDPLGRARKFKFRCGEYNAKVIEACDYCIVKDLEEEEKKTQ